MHRRLVLLRKARHRIAARAGSLGEAGGSPGAAARCGTLAGEVLPLLDACRCLEREARRILAPRRPRGRGRPFWLRGMDLEIFRAPLGVVLIIGPSRHPLFAPGLMAIQALAAGNSVILEPGEGGTAVAKAFQGCLVDSGLDARLFQILPEAGAAGEAFRAGVDKVLLTDAAKTGAAGLDDVNVIARNVIAADVIIPDVIAPTIVPAADTRLPFGGRERGGQGVPRGAGGLLELTRVKAVAVRKRKSHRHVEELRPQDEKILDSYLRAAHCGTLRERLAARGTLLRSLRKRLS